MKKLTILLLSLGAFLAGCKEDNIINDEPMAREGEVVFAINLESNEPLSRTVYGDMVSAEGGNAAYYPLYWQEGDTIRVYSPGCNPTEASYKIDMDETDNHKAASMTKVDTGLSWKDGTTQADFYAVYPASSADKSDIFTPGTDGAVSVTRTVSRYQNANVLKQPTLDGSVMTDNMLSGDMTNNIMWAYASGVKNGDPVKLTFKPVTTVLQVNLKDLVASGNKQNSIIIESVTVTAPEGTTIAGDLTVNFSADGTATTTVSNGTNTITAFTTAGESKNQYVEIPYGGNISVNIFMALASQQTLSENWVISVNTNAGTFTKKLTNTNTGSTIQPGKINVVKMPQFTPYPSGGAVDGWEYTLDNWMAQIPDNVYLSEISLPGPWYFLTEVYQWEQAPLRLLPTGIRCAGVETCSRIKDGVPVLVQTDNPSGEDMKTLMERIIDNGFLQQNNSENHDTEFFVLVFSHRHSSASDSNDDHSTWIEAAYNSYNKLEDKYKARIYTGPITNRTTIGDVRGKMIIKLNIDSTIQLSDADNTTTPDYITNMPALMSNVMNAWIPGPYQATSLEAQMFWSKWNNSYNQIYTGTDNRSDMYFYYTAGNLTEDDPGDENNDLPSLTERKSAINTLLVSSRSNYLSSNHNIWFMFGIGGAIVTSSEETVSKEQARALAKIMNPYMLDIINKKVANGDASPLGMILYNYVFDPEKLTEAADISEGYYSKPLLNSIIQMNQRFYLRRDLSRPVPYQTNTNNSN